MFGCFQLLGCLCRRRRYCLANCPAQYNCPLKPRFVWTRPDEPFHLLFFCSSSVRLLEPKTPTVGDEKQAATGKVASSTPLRPVVQSIGPCERRRCSLGATGSQRSKSTLSGRAAAAAATRTTTATSTSTKQMPRRDVQANLIYTCALCFSSVWLQ